MILPSFDYRTKRTGHYDAPDDAICTAHHARGLSVKAAAAICNLRANVPVKASRFGMGSGLLTEEQTVVIFLCSACLETTGEAERDLHADLSRGRPL